MKVFVICLLCLIGIPTMVLTQWTANDAHRFRPTQIDALRHRLREVWAMLGMLLLFMILLVVAFFLDRQNTRLKAENAELKGYLLASEAELARLSVKGGQP